MALGLKYKTQWLNCGYNIICMNFVQCLLKSFYFSKNLHHYNSGLYNNHKNKHVTRYQFTILSFINHWFLCSLVFECPIYLICSQVVKNIKIIINLHFQRKFPRFNSGGTRRSWRFFLRKHLDSPIHENVSAS